MLFLNCKERRSGFTLIELLIVIAIILILIAIALPNFLEAKIRATVTKVKAELRTLHTAVEFYATDHNSQYPILRGKIFRNRGDINRGGVHDMYDLTTPVSYIESDVIIAGDPFTVLDGIRPDGYFVNGGHYSYGYINILLYREMEANRGDVTKGVHTAAFVVHSLGPDKIKGPDARGGNWNNADYARDPLPPFFDKHFLAWNYSATNGTRSAGDILRFP